MKKFFVYGSGVVVLFLLATPICAGTVVSPSQRAAPLSRQEAPMTAPSKGEQRYKSIPTQEQRRGKYADPYNRKIPYQGTIHEGYMYGKKNPYQRND